MAGVSFEDYNAPKATGRGVQRQVFFTSLVFTLGFATVFVALGAGASSVGAILRQNIELFARIGGIIIIIMGLHFMGLFRIPFLAQEARFNGGGKPATLSGAYIMGLAFAFGWTPCIGPVLGAILGVAAARDTVGSGAMLLAFYSLGLAVPFWFAALFSGAFMRFMVRFRKYIGTVEKITGGLLVLTGILFLTGGMATMAYWLLETFPALGSIG